jgi:hypothetical protein
VSKTGKPADNDDTTIIRPVQWECKKSRGGVQVN